VATLYLGLGTNLGDKAENLRNAIRALAPRITVEEVSPVYETVPLHVTDQPHFYNLALRGTTSLTPAETLSCLKGIERVLGRAEGERYGPRLIDLDLLFYDDAMLETEELTVPHPRIAERVFVLAPLADLAPDLVHPESKKSVRVMLDAIPEREAFAKKASVTL